MTTHNLSPLALLGIQLQNYHSRVNDPIWSLGSAFFSGRRVPQLERRVLILLRQLIGNPHFNQPALHATINRLRRVMREL
jgi:hypothetical protein